MQRAFQFIHHHHHPYRRRYHHSTFAVTTTTTATTKALQFDSNALPTVQCCFNPFPLKQQKSQQQQQQQQQQKWRNYHKIIITCDSNLYNTKQHTLQSSVCCCYSKKRTFSTTAFLSTTQKRTESEPKPTKNKTNNLSIAIVGTGPSGMYTAKYLRSSILHNENITAQQQQQQQQQQYYNLNIDMIEQLPTPYGLVRSGVAPDHPEVKNVEHDFDSLFSSSSSSSSSDSIEFMGNVKVGKDVSLQELRRLYNVVILSYGCESDKKLDIEGGGLRGVLSAREFVAWYNGHPDFVYIGDEISKLLSSSSSLSSKQKHQVVVIGQGNVALDCARILAKGKPGLIDTDIATHALDVLGDGVEKTIVLGRRGHVQGAFTIKELRELTKLQKEGHDVSFHVRQDELDMGTTPSTKEELKLPGSRPKVRIDKLLRDVAAAAAGTASKNDDAKKQIELRFLLQPMKFLPDERDSTRVGSLVCQRTKLKGEPGKQVAVATGVEEIFPVSLVLVSIGYKGVPLPELEEEGFFDHQKGIVRNNHGKVTGPNHGNSNDPDDHLCGVYVSGWLKRGPNGIIGTNIADAKDTVASILFDLKNGEILGDDEKIAKDVDIKGLSKGGREGLNVLLKERGVRVVDWDLYQRIDAEEKNPVRLRSATQPREKITDVQEMLQVP